MIIVGLLGVLAVATPPKPNVVIILADDQGYGDLGRNGNPHGKTPHIDSLAQAGAAFERFFVSSLCAPTRASLLTGRYSLRTGVWGVTGRREAMRAEEVTLAEILKPAGYRTGIFGKWHNGEQYPRNPQGQGFDEVYGFRGGHLNDYFDPALDHNGKTVQTRGYVADTLTNKAIEFIAANRKRPFFCYVAYNTPHSPYSVPDKYFDPWKAKGFSDQEAAIAGMTVNLDENVGRLLASLDKLGLARDTIVMYASDNGANSDRFNVGMNGRKGSAHEGGSRVPFHFRWPGHVAAGKRVSQIAAHIDVVPTLVDLLGLPPPAGVSLDGKSLRPLLEGDGAGWPERMLFAHNAYKKPGPFPGAVRSQRYRAVNMGERWELYDMQSDPGETKNVATGQPEVVKKLSQAYDKWFADVSVGAFPLMPLPVGHAQMNPVELTAPQAILQGSVKFRGEQGYSHDWITGWTSVDGRVTWELDVARAGTYEVALSYLSKITGARIRVQAGDGSTEAVLKATAWKPVKIELRVPETHYRSMEWATLKAGRLHLDAGPTKLTVSAASKPDGEVMDLKQVSLRYVGK